MFRKVLFLLILVCVNSLRAQTSCGIPGQSSSFIINGTDAKQGAWPWIAAIMLTRTDQFICGGTIVGSKFIVTAAHCIHDKNLNDRTEPKHSTDIIVKLGKFDLSRKYERGAIDSYVIEIILHPEWNSYERQYNADVAVLVLESAIEVNAFISPICLWTSGDAPKGNKGIIVGWGKSESAAAHENTPKQLKVTIRQNERCYLNDPRFAAISSETTFCAGKDGMSGPCAGDSGSGLFIKVGSGTNSRYFLRGIVSAGFILGGVCDVSVDVIYTDALKVTNWITQVIASKEPNQVAPPAASGRGKEIFCFFTFWSEYREGKGQFSLSDLKPELCTTLVFLHALLDGDNLKSENPAQQLDEGSRLFRRFNDLKKTHPHLRTLLSIGSWNQGSPVFSALAADPTRRKRFAENSAKYLEQFEFDGLHFHWEYPAHRGGDLKDKENFVSLLQDIRNVYNRHELYLSAFLRVHTDVVKRAYDIRSIGKLVDAMLLMTFDMSGPWNKRPWDQRINFPAALMADNDDAIQSRVDYFISQGAPAEKLILGIPFYGRTFVTDSEGNIGDPTDNVAFAGPFFHEPSFLGYNEICNMKNNDWNVRFDQKTSQAIGKFKSNGKTNVVTFDTPRSVANKVKFMSEKHLGGVWTWFVDSDDFRGDCEPDSTAFADYSQKNITQSYERGYPLLRTINKAYEVLESSDQSK